MFLFFLLLLLRLLRLICRFRILDSHKKLTPNDWGRVVAVFAQGADWQFKGWKWKTPTEIFDAVKGFYMGYTGEKRPPTISQWDVIPLSVDKTQRHRDLNTQIEFWKVLDAFLLIRKPEYLPGTWSETS